MVSDQANAVVSSRQKDFEEEWRDGYFAAHHGICPKCAADLPFKWFGWFRLIRCACGYESKHYQNWYLPSD